jgi:putative ABC transport system permease protein
LNLLSLAWRNLRAQKIRTLATLAGVALAVASFVALVGLARGVGETLSVALETRGTDVVVTEAGSADLFASVISDSLVTEIAAIPGVDAAAAEMTRMTSLADGRSLIVSAWAEEAFPWQALTLVDGELPFAADTPTAAIGEGLAERYGLEVGQTIELFQSEFRIVGIVGARSVLARNLVMILLGDAQRLSFREGQATSISIRLDPDAPAEAHRQTIERLQATFPAYAVDETEKLASGYTFARIADVLAKAISIVAFASAVFAIFNTMSMSVHERRGEIAIMSAVGWPRRRIVVYIVVEGMLLTTVAGIAGAALGVVAAHSVSTTPTIAGFIHPEISVMLVVEAAAMSLAIGLAGSLLPALRTVSLSPASVLRGK